MIVDTAGVFPETKRILLECSGVPEERNTRGTVFWDFSIKTEEGANYNESVPIWLAAPIFRAMQFKELTPGKFDVDPPSALGRKVICDIVHETIKDKVYARMKNITADSGIPF
jgi:hypothetical protein